MNNIYGFIGSAAAAADTQVKLFLSHTRRSRCRLLCFKNKQASSPLPPILFIEACAPFAPITIGFRIAFFFLPPPIRPNTGYEQTMMNDTKQNQISPRRRRQEWRPKFFRHISPSRKKISAEPGRYAVKYLHLHRSSPSHIYEKLSRIFFRTVVWCKEEKKHKINCIKTWMSRKKNVSRFQLESIQCRVIFLRWFKVTLRYYSIS